MASRVNTRFVAFLAIGLMLLGGGVMVAAYFALKKGGADYAKMGEKFMTEANYEKAAEYFGKAVFKSRTNAEYIDKWIKAMGKTMPTPREAYFDRYLKDYMPALKAYADALPEDVAAQERFLGEQYERMKYVPRLEPAVWDDFIAMVDDAIKRFADQGGAVRKLRRYKAYATIHKLPSLPDDKVKGLYGPIREDLEAARAAAPDDDTVAAELASLDMMLGQQAHLAKDEAGAARLEQAATERLEGFLKAHPESALVYWTQMRVVFAQKSRAPVPISFAQLYLDEHPRFVRLFELIRAEPESQLDILLLSQVCMEARRSTRIGNAGVLELLYDLEGTHPGSIFLKMVIGRFELLSLHYDKAVAAYQRVIDTPDLPLSYDGWVLYEQRAEAYKQQILARLAAGDAPSLLPEEKQAALAQAKALRGKLAEYTTATEAILLYVDAKIAYADGNYESARINLDRYNERTLNADVQARLLQAQIMDKLGNTGAARTGYAGILEREPNNVDALLSLADLEQHEQNFCEAQKQLEAVKKLFPNFPQLDERLSRMRQLCEYKTTKKEITDPVARAMMLAQEMCTGVNPDYVGAAALLEETLNKTGDLALYPPLAHVLVAAGQRDRALAVVKQGLDKSPDSPKLRELFETLKVSDPLQAVLIAIDQDEKASAFQKAVWRYLAYMQGSKKEDADKALAEVVKLDPEHPVTLELTFRTALAGKDLVEARRIADVATARDADHMGGLTYRAQLEAMDGHVEEAARTLEAALEKDRNSVPVLRQLGILRLKTGKPELAADAFEKALAIRPQDVDSIKGRIKARLMLGQRDEALDFARRSQNSAVADMEFVDLWLSLEATASGGDRGKALNLRQELAKRFPGNERNNEALVILLIDAGRFAEAKTAIDKLRAGGDRPTYVELEIRWCTAQGNLRGAIDTFNTWVRTLPPEKHTEEPYVALANIVSEYGRLDAAEQFLKDARAHQDPKTMGADRKLGEVYFQMQRYDQAVVVLERVLASNPADPEYKVVGLIIEAEIRQRKFDEARRRLDALGSAIDANARMLLLKADTYLGLGNLEEAGRTYDAAVAAAKDDPIGYIKRAEFLVRDPQRFADAEQDLKQAVALNPRLTGARERLAALHMRNKDPAKAIVVLREGITVDPDNDQLRVDLIGLHLQLKQDREAIQVVDEALRRRPEDPQWLFRGREVMYALNRLPDAAAYAWRLWEKKKDVEAALAYLDAAVRMDPTDYIKVMQVLNTPELKTATNLRLLMARARVQLKRQRGMEAKDDLRAALALIDQNDANQSRVFMSGMTLIYPDPKERVAALADIRPRDGYRGWMAVLFSTLRTTIPEFYTEAMTELRAIAAGNAAGELRQQTYAIIGARLRTEKKYEEALAVWLEGLKLDDGDAELNNNVAYTLVEDMKKPQDALPYALRAVQAMPANPSVQDTLGKVYLELEQPDKAEVALARALATAAEPEESVAICIHFAELRLKQGKATEAARFLRQAEELTQGKEDLKKQFEEAIRELQGKIGSNK